MTLSCQRDLFGLPPEVTYLNACYWSPLAEPVRRAGIAGIERKAEPWALLPPHYFEGTEALAALFAQLLGAAPRSVAVTPSTSYGIATAARNLPLAAGESVLLLEDQYPSNYYAWRDATERVGARVTTVPRPDGKTSWSDAVLERIGPGVRVVTLPHVHWSDGSRFDLEAVGARCREIGAGLVLDLTQSAGVLPFSIERVDPDFVVAASYKWLLGPYSLSYLYAAPRHHLGTPIEQGWMAREGSEDFANLARYQHDLLPDARRFNVGESSNFVLVPMAAAALELILGWTVEAITGYLAGLTRRLRRGAAELGIDHLAEELAAPHIVGLQLPGGPRRELVEQLSREQIHVSLRGSSLRVSPHVYNDESDIDRLLEALASAR